MKLSGVGRVSGLENREMNKGDMKVTGNDCLLPDNNG